MAWLKVDDRVRTHPKVVKAGPAASWFWFCGICYCREHLTDGFIQHEMLPTLVPGESKWKRLAASLVAVGLWHDVDGGYQVHDFLDWNPARATVLEKRKEDNDRKKRRGVHPDSDMEARADSATDSTVDSVRTPQGFLAEPSRDRARNAGLGSGSSGVAANHHDMEESPRETKPGPLLARGSTLAWDAQQQREHAACLPEHCRWRTASVRVCFPATFIGRFSRLQPAALDDDPSAWVLAWVRRIEADPGYAPSNASMFEHWQAQWNAAHGAAKPSTTGRTKAALQRFVGGGGS